VSYIFMVFHYPQSERRDDLLRGMAERGQLLLGVPGLIEVGAWTEEGSDRLVGISKWESKEAFLAAVPPGFGEPSDEIHDGETRPRERFHFHLA
jgi:hypothetical protein